MKKNGEKIAFLNKLDLLILTAVITGLLIIFVGIKFVFQKDEYVTVEMIASGGEWWWGTPAPFYWNTNPLQKGDIEYDVLHKPLVEVLDVKKFPDDSRKITWVKARIKARKNVRTNSYSFRQSKIEIGRTITISPNNIAVIGQVISIEGVGQLGEAKDIIITGKLYGMHPWRTEIIRVGDVVKNDDGEVVAEILEKQVEASEITTVNWQGDNLLRRDALMKDMTLKMRMKVQKEKDNYYFVYYQLIQEGLAVHLQTTNTQIEPFILKIEEV